MITLSHSRIALLAIGLLIAIMAFSAYRIEPGLGLENNSLVLFEEKITKNKALAIAPGESYTYTYIVGNESVNATYLIEEGGGCTIINLQGTQASVCVDEAGNDRSGQNSTYPLPVMMFKPWMLAVDEYWKWNVSSHIVFEGFEKSVEAVRYSVVRKEYYKDRESFVVRINSSLGEEVWNWVDADKRILLREIGPGYELVLVEGLPSGR